jgi:hypothetical protein
MIFFGSLAGFANRFCCILEINRKSWGDKNHIGSVVKR